jgi:4-amino-4-deoxy-L-arabinose transferase-like glycosyltransferase
LDNTQENRWDREANGGRGLVSRDPLFILLVVVGCLAPFLTKAYHMDDSVYLWVAQHIRQHVFDFYGFAANWYGWEMPMPLINQNPPLVSYALALASLLVGWNELGLHLLFMVPAIAAGVGMWYLVCQLCRQPLIAALIAVLTPVFIVSATTLMADTLMMAFYVWAVALWVRGIHNGLAYVHLKETEKGCLLIRDSLRQNPDNPRAFALMNAYCHYKALNIIDQ